MRKIKSFDLETLKTFVTESLSWATLLGKMEIDYHGNTIKTIRKYFLENNISLGHFTGQGHNKGKTYTRTDIKDYLNNSKKTSSNELRKRLIKEGYKEHKCEKCHNTTWLDNPIPICLHHVDGNHSNNLLENLEVLCYNCHALTPNFVGKNIKSGKKVRSIVSDEDIIKNVLTSYCRSEALLKCGLQGKGGNYTRINKIIKQHNLIFLQKASAIPNEDEIKSKIEEIRNNFTKKIEPDLIINTKHNNNLAKRVSNKPDKELLSKLIIEKSLLSIANEYGVCDNSVRGWCRRYGIELPKFPIGYWARRQHGMTHEQALNPPPKKVRQKQVLLDIEVVKAIKLDLLNNIRIRDIVKDRNVSKHTVLGIKSGHSYRYVEI